MIIILVVKKVMHIISCCYKKEKKRRRNGDIQTMMKQKEDLTSQKYFSGYHMPGYHLHVMKKMNLKIGISVKQHLGVKIESKKIYIREKLYILIYILYILERYPLQINFSPHLWQNCCDGSNFSVPHLWQYSDSTVEKLVRPCISTPSGA